MPSISLHDGTTLFGHPTPEHLLRVYDHYLDRVTRRRIEARCFGLAVDTVLRYLYPHAEAGAAPPTPLKNRGRFHLQHRDTIEDLPVSKAVRKALRKRFAIRSGDLVVDVGAYLGLGAMAISRRVGPHGRVVSLEADSGHQTIWRRNIETNEIANATLVPAGCWKERGRFEMRCDGLQANTLADVGVVKGVERRTVEMISLDEVVREQGLHTVDLISLTVNGGEIEAIEGAEHTLKTFAPNLSIAGWYQRDGRRVADIVIAGLNALGYETCIGPMGRVYAWMRRRRESA